jgi:VWFA-related protein
MGAREGMTLGLAYRKLCRHQKRWLAVLVMLLIGTAGARAQETSSPPADGQNATAPAAAKTASEPPTTQPAKTPEDKIVEVSSKDTNTTFKLRVNLVQVKVVVRDATGNLVPDLHREDFQLFDQGKPQIISTFGVETPESRRKRAEAAAKTQTEEDGAAPGEEKAVLPARFVALVFDDIHLEMADMVFVRSSTKKLIESLTATDRMGIYTTSGQVTEEFTSDKEALTKKMLSLAPRPMMGKFNSVSNCPDVTYYMADQALNKSNPQILPVVATEVLQCQFQNNPSMASQAASIAQAALQQELLAGDTDNEYTYRHLEDVVRRMAGMPGERVMVLVSPGFILAMQYLDEMGIIDRANRSNVVINTVDARGLYAPNIMGDIAQQSTDTPQTSALKATFRLEEQSENGFVLSDFAAGTGGTYFHNSNDLEKGLQQAGAAPEVCYVLGFSPQNQKMDGRFHTLKVSLTGKRKYTLQARRGYYAPKKVDDPEQEAKQEIAEAVFSQDEIEDLPLELQTQYFKTGDAGVHLSVVSRIDLKSMHFRKAEGRNFDNLTVATAIFDDNGNFVTGGEKLLEMRLLDATYSRMSHTGLTMKSSFDVKPGKYLVRQVIRDSEGAQMAAKNGAVVIPY